MFPAKNPHVTNIAEFKASHIERMAFMIPLTILYSLLERINEM
jgi:hypothetical protein